MTIIKQNKRKILDEIYQVAQQGNVNTHIVGFLTIEEKEIIEKDYGYKVSALGCGYNQIIFSNKNKQ